MIFTDNDFHRLEREIFTDKKEIVHRFQKEIKEKDCPLITLIYAD